MRHKMKKTTDRIIWLFTVEHFSWWDISLRTKMVDQLRRLKTSRQDIRIHGSALLNTLNINISPISLESMFSYPAFAVKRWTFIHEINILIITLAITQACFWFIMYSDPGYRIISSATEIWLILLGLWLHFHQLLSLLSPRPMDRCRTKGLVLDEAANCVYMERAGDLSLGIMVWSATHKCIPLIHTHCIHETQSEGISFPEVDETSLCLHWKAAWWTRAVILNGNRYSMMK